MRVAIIGSRDFTDYDGLCRFVAGILDIGSITQIISGGARGADRLAERFAYEHEINLKVYPAQWDRYGRRAGIIRNRFIVDASDIVVACWDGRSRGTASTIRFTRQAGKALYIHRFL